MTRNSPEPDAGRLPENLDENHSDDLNHGTLTERDLTEGEDVEEPQIGDNGYELLPTSLCENEDEEDDSDEIEFGFTTFDGQEFQTRTSHNYHTLLATVDTPTTSAASCNEKPTIPLDTNQIETIKSIMSKVTLPSTAIPVWAHSVSDEQLKKVVEEKAGKGTDENWAVFE